MELKNYITINESSYTSKDKWTFVNYLDTGNLTENRISDLQFIDLKKDKLPSRAKLNKHRLTYMEKLQEIVDKYNCVDANLDQFLHDRVNLTNELNQEEKRHIQENLSEEELVIYDILTRPEPKLSKKEIEKVKLVAKELLLTIKKERLNAGWRNMQSGRAKLKVTIDRICDTNLPSVYDENIFKEKCDMLYIHFYDNYPSSTPYMYA